MVLEDLGDLLHRARHARLVLDAGKAVLSVRAQIIHKYHAVWGVRAHALHGLLHDADVVHLEGGRGVVAGAGVGLEDHRAVVLVHSHDADVRHLSVEPCGVVAHLARLRFGTPLYCLLQHVLCLIHAHVACPQVAQHGDVGAELSRLWGAGHLVGNQFFPEAVQHLLLSARRLWNFRNHPAALGLQSIRIPVRLQCHLLLRGKLCLDGFAFRHAMVESVGEAHAEARSVADAVHLATCRLLAAYLHHDLDGSCEFLNLRGVHLGSGLRVDRVHLHRAVRHRHRPGHHLNRRAASSQRSLLGCRRRAADAVSIFFGWEAGVGDRGS
mmetsp:Transcript_42610/g.110495  ORF Transcript_42610/g.110495 Transcript_42610/m.110495 type:complete len:325 (+) Transcript_42610:297-1271(+)